MLCPKLESNGPFHYLFIGCLTQILAFVIIDGSYLRFHTLFTRGPKVRLFCSPQWSSIRRGWRRVPKHRRKTPHDCRLHRLIFMHVRRSVPIYLTHLDAQWRVGPPKRHSSFGADVCHSSPFLDNLHFDDFVKIQPWLRC